jgi:hypothetical protein
MGLNHCSVDQRHILDEQTQNAFSLAGLDAGIIPDAWKIRNQGEQLLPGLRVNQQTLLLCLLLVLFLRLGQRPEFVIPFRFQAIDDQPIVGIDLHVTTAGEFHLVVGSLHVLPPQRVGLGHAGLNFLLNGEGHL